MVFLTRIKLDHVFIKHKILKPYLTMTAQWNHSAYCEEPYYAPPWCSQLNSVPKSRLKLAQLPTPIHRWNLPGQPENVNIYIKRDDLTGSTLSGNKVRKLEFLLADALRLGCKHVITCGGEQSNHARASAAAATQLGLKSHLVLRSASHKEHSSVSEYTGNLFLDCMFGSALYMVPKSTPYDTQLKPRMKKIADKIRQDFGEESYLIPVGGSNRVGIYGYIEGFRELLSQDVADHVTDIVFACGSGGTAEGLALANYLAGTGIRIHGISVCDDASYFHGHVNSVFNNLGITDVKSEDLLHIIDGYKGKGYGITEQKDLDFIHEVSRTTGIVLDPTYTGKAAWGLVQELQSNPQRFKGTNILFIHTGGIFGAMDGRLAQSLSADQSKVNCYTWDSLEHNPWDR